MQLILVPRNDDGTLASADDPQAESTKQAYDSLEALFQCFYQGMRIDCTHYEIGLFVTVKGIGDPARIGDVLGCAVFRPYTATSRANSEDAGAQRGQVRRRYKEFCETFAAGVARAFPQVLVYSQASVGLMLYLRLPEEKHVELARAIADTFDCDVCDQSSGPEFQNTQRRAVIP